MRCSACKLDLLENPKEHYKSDLHRINIKRQIYMIPPISQDELVYDSCSDSVSIELLSGDTSEEVSSVDQGAEDIKNIKKPKARCDPCVFCEELGFIDHYSEKHGLSDDQVVYLIGRTCYICNEGFTTFQTLKEHFDTDNHRKVVIDGNKLILENGKMLYDKKKSVQPQEIVKSKRRNEKNGAIVHYVKTEKQIEYENKKEKDILKTFLQNNIQKHFRPQWMQ